MLKPHGIDLPVYPVKGYSLSVPITDPAGAPESTVMDEYHKVAITRLGDRIRVGGMAELDGYSTALHAAPPRDARACRHRLLRRRRRCQGGHLLGRAPPDDARTARR